MSTSQQLPSNPSFRHLKLQAKRLHESWQSADPDTYVRVAAVLPRLSEASDTEIRDAGLTLRESQFIIAREYGFDSWAKLKAHVDSSSETVAMMDRRHREALSAVHQRYASLLATTFSDAIGQPVQVAQDRHIDQPFDAFVSGLGDGFCTWRFAIKPDGWPHSVHAPIAIDLSLPLAGALLGQTNATAESVFDDRMRMSPVVRKFVGDFEKIWEQKPTMRVGDARIAVEPDHLQIASSNEPCVVIPFDVRSAGLSTRVQICFPKSSLESVVIPYLDGRQVDGLQLADSTGASRLTNLFSDHQRGRLAIDRILDGAAGLALTDNASAPTAGHLVHEGDSYFAGDPNTEIVRQMVESRRTVRLIPESDRWSRLIEDVFGPNLEREQRIEFSAEKLSDAHLRRLAGDIPHDIRIEPIDAPRVEQLRGGLHPQITDGYTTTADFLNSGLGFCARRDDDPICSASTDFTHQGRAKINLEFTVGQVDRRIELATCAAAVLACLEAEIEPHWRNVRSHGGLLGQLAKGLGYIPREEYEILAPKDTGAEDEARRLVRKTDI